MGYKKDLHELNLNSVRIMGAYSDKKDIAREYQILAGKRGRTWEKRVNAYNAFLQDAAKDMQSYEKIEAFKKSWDYALKNNRSLKELIQKTDSNSAIGGKIHNISLALNNYLDLHAKMRSPQEHYADIADTDFPASMFQESAPRLVERVADEPNAAFIQTPFRQITKVERYSPEEKKIMIGRKIRGAVNKILPGALALVFAGAILGGSMGYGVKATKMYSAGYSTGYAACRDDTEKRNRLGAKVDEMLLLDKKTSAPDMKSGYSLQQEKISGVTTLVPYVGDSAKLSSTPASNRNSSAPLTETEKAIEQLQRDLENKLPGPLSERGNRGYLYSNHSAPEFSDKEHENRQKVKARFEGVQEKAQREGKKLEGAMLPFFGFFSSIIKGEPEKAGKNLVETVTGIPKAIQGVGGVLNASGEVALRAVPAYGAVKYDSKTAGNVDNLLHDFADSSLFGDFDHEINGKFLDVPNWAQKDGLFDTLDNNPGKSINNILQKILFWDWLHDRFKHKSEGGSDNGSSVSSAPGRTGGPGTTPAEDLIPGAMGRRGGPGIAH